MNLVTIKSLPIDTGSDAPRLKRFSVEEYHRLLEIGFLNEDDRIELIRGDLVERAAKGTKHIFCCQELSGILHILVNRQAISRCQDPIILTSGSEPEPDFTIVRLTPDRYRSRKPEAFQNSRDEFEYGLKQVYRIHQTIDLPAPLTGTIVLAEVL